MMRRVLTSLFVAATALVLVARTEHPAKAQQPAPKAGIDQKAVDDKKLDPKAVQDQAGLAQQRLQAQYRDLTAMLLRLAQRLEKSERQEDRDRAVVLHKALGKANEEEIDTKFTTLVRLLSRPEALDLDGLDKAMKESREVADLIRAILAIILGDRDAEIKAEKERLTRLLEDIKRVLREQQNVRAWTDRNMPKDNLLPKQNDVTKATEAIARAMGKDGQGGEGKAGKSGEAKGEGKPGDAKGEGKNDTKENKGGSRGDDRDSKPTDPKDGKPSEGKGAGNESKDGKPSEGKGAGNESKDGKPGEGKDGMGDGKGQPGEGKDSKGGEGKGQPGEGKDGKGGEGKGQPGEGKDGKGSESKDGKPGEGKEGGKGDGSKDSQGGEGKGAGKPSDPKEAKSGSKGGDGKGDSKGKGDGKGDGKGGEGKGEGSQGSPSQGGGEGQGKGQGQGQGQQGGSKGSGQQGNQGQQGGNQNQKDDGSGKKQVQDANDYQNKAEDNIKNDDRNKAGNNQDEAIRKLKEAQKKLEDLLRQLREEEIERLLAQLQARCEKMLSMQREVLEGTITTYKGIGDNGNKFTREHEQASYRLSDREAEIVRECVKCLEILRAEGTAVAFPEVFEQLQADMTNVERRLRRVDVGLVTQAIEKDIIDTLLEMIEALKKARQQNQQQQGQPGEGQQGQPQDQKLIDLIAELKMIRNMQIRVNDRTKMYGRYYPEAEQVPDLSKLQDKGEVETAEMVQRELKNLSDRQDKIREITNNIAKGKNK
jgi:hypothetical protein